jgi:hypothetical protein
MGDRAEPDKFRPARMALMKAWSQFNKGKIREATESCIASLNIAEKTRDWRVAEDALVLLERLLTQKRPNVQMIAQLTRRAQSIASAKQPPKPPRAAAAEPRRHAAVGLATELATLADLLERGHLTAEKFAQAKAQILQGPAPPSRQPGARPTAADSPGVAGRTIGATAAGAVGGMLLSNVGSRDAAAPSDPTTEHVQYQETFTGPDGETMTIEGEMDSTVTYDETGEMHVDIHDEGSTTIEGETFEYTSDLESTAELGDLGDAGGGLFDSLGDL